MVIYKVVKRNGSMEKFQPKKIYNAVSKTLKHVDPKNMPKARKLTHEILNILNKKYKSKTIPVETIKKTVRHVLLKHKMTNAARFYTLHRYI